MRLFSLIDVDIDRDSVAMGDDVESHAHRIKVASGMRLSTLLNRASPGIRQRGWSWVAVADGRVLAVWSVDYGVQLLVPDSRMTSKGGPHRVHFRYFLQIDPAWLHRRLAEGANPHLKSLELEYQPLARAAREKEQRRRERELPDRLMSVECTAALRSFGAQIDLHNDRTIRFDLFGKQWTANRADTMTQIYVGEGGPAASIRPSRFAECWLVAAVGAEMRVSRDLPRLPHFHPLPAPPLEPMTSWPPGVQRWTTNGNLVAQLSGDDAVAYFRIAVGRSIAEIAELVNET